MKSNVFKDFPFVKTNKGPMTVEEFFHSSHEESLHLDLSIPGYEYGAIWRLLASLTAVIVQRDPSLLERGENGSELRLDPEFISQILDDLGSKISLTEGKNLFFQRPLLEGENPKDTARYVGPGKDPAWKLSPTAPSEKSQIYWNLEKLKPESLEAVDAIVALMVFSMYSFTGNSKYDGAKCLNGSPGIRFLGGGNTATEFIIESKTPLLSLLKSTPLEWCEPGGLPAWLDRTGAESRKPNGEMHPLWRATWSSNTAACCWDGETLIGVGIGGIPPEWYALEMGSKPEARKEWWDQRNTEDPFYFYQPDKGGALKAKRLDLSRDLTELAVEWVAEDLSTALAERVRGRALRVDFKKEDSLLFIRHQIGGNASSAMIRESVVSQARKQQWVFDPTGALQKQVRGKADFILSLRNIVLSPFRRENKSDRDRGRRVLDNLASERPKMNETFWREIAPIYEEFILYFTEQVSGDETRKEVRAQAKKTLKELEKDAVRTAQKAFDMVLEPYLLQNPSQAYEVRRRIHSYLASKIAEANEGDQK